MGCIGTGGTVIVHKKIFRSKDVENMIIKTLNRSEAQNEMKDWILKYPSLPEVEGDYLKIRKDIQEFNQKVRNVG